MRTVGFQVITGDDSLIMFRASNCGTWVPMARFDDSSLAFVFKFSDLGRDHKRFWVSAAQKLPTWEGSGCWGSEGHIQDL